MSTYQIRDFGAVGDGLHLETAKIQAAVDLAANNGGGTVVFSAGRYLSGTIVLRDNITMRLERGSEIIGSPNIQDYITDNSFIFPRWYLIAGKNIKNISIEGGGTINGNGEAFREKEINEVNGRFTLKPERPRGIYFNQSENIRIEGVIICDTPCYSIWLHGCRSMAINGVVIRNNRRHGTSDGIDIDCCENVMVSNCDINAGDDCIALKNDACRLGKKMNCERIVINNCILSTRAAAIRIGYESDGGHIRDCTFNNLVINEASRGLLLQSLALPEFEKTRVAGTRIENIAVSNVTLRDVLCPLFIFANKGQNGYIRQVNLSNWSGESAVGAYIGAYEKGIIEDIYLTNMRLRIAKEIIALSPAEAIAASRLHVLAYKQPEAQEERDLYPNNPEGNGFALPYGLALRHVSNIHLRDFSIINPARKRDEKGALRWLGVKTLNIDGKNIKTENGSI